MDVRALQSFVLRRAFLALLLPAEALRETKQRLRADPRWSRPALWAGYVLIGNPPAVAERRPPRIWILGLALAAVAILLGWRWLRG